MDSGVPAHFTQNKIKPLAFDYKDSQLMPGGPRVSRPMPHDFWSAAPWPAPHTNFWPPDNTSDEYKKRSERMEYIQSPRHFAVIKTGSARSGVRRLVAALRSPMLPHTGGLPPGFAATPLLPSRVLRGPCSRAASRPVWRLTEAEQAVTSRRTPERAAATWVLFAAMEIRIRSRPRRRSVAPSAAAIGRLAARDVDEDDFGGAGFQPAKECINSTRRVEACATSADSAGLVQKPCGIGRPCTDCPPA